MLQTLCDFEQSEAFVPNTTQQHFFQTFRLSTTSTLFNLVSDVNNFVSLFSYMFC